MGATVGLSIRFCSATVYTGASRLQASRILNPPSCCRFLDLPGGSGKIRILRLFGRHAQRQKRLADICTPSRLLLVHDRVVIWRAQRLCHGAILLWPFTRRLHTLAVSERFRYHWRFLHVPSLSFSSLVRHGAGVVPHGGSILRL